ncbi:MAG: hypothetical protein EHM70_13400 [Chloroflexota bacterium]|nr:MAG: hypothetical protein EHM70_13400 [Chloroflexota bacterium]
MVEIYETVSEVAPANRPRSVTLLALGVLTIASVNILRLVQAVKLWDFLAGLPGVMPLYIALTGLAWMCAGLPLALALWRGKRGAPRAAMLFALGYTLYHWLDRVFVASRPLTPTSTYTWPFQTVVTIVLLILVYWMLTNRKARAFFRRNE